MRNAINRRRSWLSRKLKLHCVPNRIMCKIGEEKPPAKIQNDGSARLICSAIYFVCLMRSLSMGSGEGQNYELSQYLTQQTWIRLLLFAVRHLICCLLAHHMHIAHKWSNFFFCLCTMQFVHCENTRRTIPDQQNLLFNICLTIAFYTK